MIIVIKEKERKSHFPTIHYFLYSLHREFVLISTTTTTKKKDKKKPIDDDDETMYKYYYYHNNSTEEYSIEYRRVKVSEKGGEDI